MARPQCIALEQATNEQLGGKAYGLCRLAKVGLHVPRGFVVAHAAPDRLPAELAQAYQRIGEGPVAVRSSATGEDSAEASFAGQYDTVLNVSGVPALERAIQQCLKSISNQRANAYRNDHRAEPHARMSVVVQSMVQRARSGCPVHRGSCHWTARQGDRGRGRRFG